METNLYVLGLIQKYEGELNLKKAQIQTYFTKDVAIGEHPDLPEEQDKLIEQACAIEEKLNFLKDNFNPNGTLI